MKRVLMLAALLLGVLVSRPDAEAKKCVPNEGCQKGQTPLKDCCKSPPCELFHELKVAKAYVRVLSNPPLSNFVSALYGDTDEPSQFKDKQRFNRNVQDELKKAHKKFAKCPPSYFYSPARYFSVRSSDRCRIDGSLEEELRTSNSCTELVEAQFARAQMDRMLCLSFMNEKEPLTIDEHRNHRRAETQAQIDYLQKKLLEYRRACTTFDAPTARRMAAAGVPVLKKSPAKKPAKKAAKRATKRRGK